MKIKAHVEIIDGILKGGGEEELTHRLGQNEIGKSGKYSVVRITNTLKAISFTKIYLFFVISRVK